MINLTEFKTLLDTTKMSVAYQHFDASNVPEMPFITYQEITSRNFLAEEKVYAKFRHMYVTLWTKEKDTTAEETMESTFDAADIPWAKNESYHEDERCYEITYEVEV